MGKIMQQLKRISALAVDKSQSFKRLKLLKHIVTHLSIGGCSATAHYCQLVVGHHHKTHTGEMSQQTNKQTKKYWTY